MAALGLAITAALVLVLAFSRVQVSTCHVLDAKISCLDCKHNYDFSGIKVAVKCDKVKKLATGYRLQATANTEENGAFKVELPVDISKGNIPSTSFYCLAKLLGGPNQLYGKNKNLVSKVVKVNSYTISTPLVFSTSCPLGKSCGVGSSKTFDLPLPPARGLAPSSYYMPFFPIIGIP